MDQNDSFQALLNPGEADNFFDIAALPPFAPESIASYSRTNALWLAEFSRLIYRQEEDEVPGRPADFRTRNQVLAGHGWREDSFFNRGGTQGGVLVRADGQCGALVFRGTLGLKDDITDVDFLPVPWEGGGFVHRGFKAALDRVWDSVVRPALSTVEFPVFFTGHSLGAALATLAAARTLQDPTIAKGWMAALYTFGSPRVGNPDFGQSLTHLFHCRVVNKEDIVPTLPPVVPVNGVTFRHTGQLHHVENNGYLLIFPPDVDVIETSCPQVSPADITGALRGLFCGIRTSGLEPPEPLRDHAPVNYTANLETSTPQPRP